MAASATVPFGWRAADTRSLPDCEDAPYTCLAKAPSVRQITFRSKRVMRMTTKNVNFLNRHPRMSGTALPACEEEQAKCLFHYPASTNSNKPPENNRWNLIAELNANSSNAVVRTYIWGLDLSGTMQGAGGGLPRERKGRSRQTPTITSTRMSPRNPGVTSNCLSRGEGGLLMVIDHAGSTKRHYAAYDGNGSPREINAVTRQWHSRIHRDARPQPAFTNLSHGEIVMGLADSTTGKWSARYEYGPFGEPMRANGDLAYANPMRWSTKYTDGESGLVYYGYRSYNPSTGRRLSRDPIDEDGGRNLYAFCLNEPLSRFDSLGLECDCGPDVTEALRATLKEVDAEFGKLDFLAKLGACAAVAGFGADPASAWDINTLWPTPVRITPRTRPVTRTRLKRDTTATAVATLAGRPSLSLANA